MPEREDVLWRPVEGLHAHVLHPQRRMERAEEERCDQRDELHRAPTSSTANTSVAFGGITPPAPRVPYPRAGGMTSVRFSPIFIAAIPSSHPWMTRPCPRGNSIGEPRSRELSNFVPSGNQPV